MCLAWDTNLRGEFLPNAFLKAYQRVSSQIWARGVTLYWLPSNLGLKFKGYIFSKCIYQGLSERYVLKFEVEVLLCIDYCILYFQHWPFPCNLLFSIALILRYRFLSLQKIVQILEHNFLLLQYLWGVLTNIDAFQCFSVETLSIYINFLSKSLKYPGNFSKKIT